MTEQEEKKPNPDCKECKGTGQIGYYFDQDDCKIANCTTCYPEDKAAKAMQRDFYRSLGYD